MDGMGSVEGERRVEPESASVGGDENAVDACLRAGGVVCLGISACLPGQLQDHVVNEILNVSIDLGLRELDRRWMSGRVPLTQFLLEKSPDIARDDVSRAANGNDFALV